VKIKQNLQNLYLKQTLCTNIDYTLIGVLQSERQAVKNDKYRKKSEGRHRNVIKYVGLWADLIKCKGF